MTLLDRALQQLDSEFACSGKKELYEALKPFLSGTTATSSYREIGETFMMSSTAIKVTMHRLRTRYRELIRDEVRQTVGRGALVTRAGLHEQRRRDGMHVRQLQKQDPKAVFEGLEHRVEHAPIAPVGCPAGQRRLR